MNKKFLILFLLLLSLFSVSSVTALSDNATDSAINVESSDNQTIQSEVTRSVDKVASSDKLSNDDTVNTAFEDNRINTSIVTDSIINTNVGIKTSLNASVVDVNGNNIESGIVSFKVNNDTFTLSFDEYASSEANMVFDQIGKYTVLVSYKGDDNYIPSNTTISVLVNGINTYLNNEPIILYVDSSTWNTQSVDKTGVNITLSSSPLNINVGDAVTFSVVLIDTAGKLLQNTDVNLCFNNK